MTPPRRGLSGRRQTRSRRSHPSGRNIYRENFTFSITPGATSNITVATLANRPPRSNFRPQSLTLTALTAYVPPSAATPGYFVPAALQILYLTPSGEYCATSGQQLLGTTPRRITVRYPRSSDWWPYNNSSTDVVATIDCVCLGTTPTNAVVRGTAQMRITISQEVVAPVCPTFLTNTGHSLHIPTSVQTSSSSTHPATLAILPSLPSNISSDSDYEESLSSFSVLETSTHA